MPQTAPRCLQTSQLILAGQPAHRRAAVHFTQRVTPRLCLNVGALQYAADCTMLLADKPAFLAGQPAHHGAAVHATQRVTPRLCWDVDAFSMLQTALCCSQTSQLFSAGKPAHHGAAGHSTQRVTPWLCWDVGIIVWWRVIPAILICSQLHLSASTVVLTTDAARLAAPGALRNSDLCAEQRLLCMSGHAFIRLVRVHPSSAIPDRGLGLGSHWRLGSQ